MKKYFYINGKIAELNKPALPANDVGVLRGYAVFDFLRTFNGKMFHLENHYKRFVNSAKQLGLKMPIDKSKTEAILYKLLRKNKTKEASFRLVLTGGATSDGLNPGKPIFFILCEDLYRLPQDIFKKGGKLISQDYARLFPESKNTNYIMAISLIEKRKKFNAVEILYVDDGKVLECSTSNIFLVKKGKLITPKNRILPGVTRKIVINLAKGHWRVEERGISTKELWSADEVFITATNKDVVPIVAIDGKRIGAGQPGKISLELLKLYKEYTAKY